MTDIQAILVTWLNQQLGSKVRVSTTIPPGYWDSIRPYPLVQVLLTGGVRATTTVDTAQITLDTYTEHDEDNVPLAAQVRDLITGLRTANGITFYQHTEVGRPVPLIDPRTDRSRYRQTHILRFGA